jgi:hypothetical protein
MPRSGHALAPLIYTKTFLVLPEGNEYQYLAVRPRLKSSRRLIKTQ